MRLNSFKREFVDRAVGTTAFPERHGAENCIRCLEPPTPGEVRLQRLGPVPPLRRLSMCTPLAVKNRKAAETHALVSQKLTHFAKESFLL